MPKREQRRTKPKHCKKCNWHYVLVGGAKHVCPDEPYVDRRQTPKGWKKGRD